MGADWASVTGNAMTNRGDTGWGVHSTYLTLAEHAEALRPTLDDASRRDHLHARARLHFGRQWKKFQPWILALLAVNFLVVPLIYVGGQGGFWEALAALPYLLGVMLLILGIFGLVELVRRSRQPKAPVEGMEAVAASLRDAGVFESVTLARATKREGLPIVRRDAGFLARARAPLVASRLEASSKAQVITLDAELCKVEWPEGTIEECRSLPDRWLTIDALGPPADLAKLPPGPREDRHSDSIRWLLTGEEIEGGAAAELFRAIATSMTSTSGPYR
jgi:hypothetical protein